MVFTFLSIDIDQTYIYINQQKHIYLVLNIGLYRLYVRGSLTVMPHILEIESPILLNARNVDMPNISFGSLIAYHYLHLTVRSQYSPDS